MEKMNGETLNIVSDNIKKLKEIFPEVFNEDKVDFEKLETVLGEYKDKGTERYNFSWPGKSKAIRIAQTPSTGTLRPCKEESKDWDTTENLYIEGDNLEVLKLLQKSYYGKVKMIYIDPPYNTGNDFVYKDDFKDNIENYLEVTGQKDAEGNKTTTNTESNGRYHSNWLNMMYPRLRLARNLLKDDGAIFISIDDNEVENLKKICNEIFGEDNFVGDIVRKTKSMTNDIKCGLNIQHEYIAIYSKNINKLNLKGEEKSFDNYSNPDNDPLGDWCSGDPSAKSGGNGTYFEIKNPITGRIDFPPKGRYWAFSQTTLNEYIKKGKIKFKDYVKEGHRGFIFKRYKMEVLNKYNPINSLFAVDNDYMNQVATKQLNELLNGSYFDYPKPSELISKLIKSIFINSESQDNIIIDFFSGSATTAQAAIEVNVELSNKIKFIMIQYPENVSKDKYRNLCDIGKKRILLAGEKIKEENKEKEGIEALDTGFKVFKLDSSNIDRWDPSYDQDLKSTLLKNVMNIKEDRREEDILYEILLKYGIDLNMPIEEHDIEGKKVFDIGFGAIIACLDKDLTLDVVEGIGKLKGKLDPDSCRVVFMDNGFASDSVKTNAVQILKRYSIDDVKCI
ncbi:site-specific DNA-methyltransferase [Clostridium butyricum]|uniref:site-specific DNA-methyltransferase n=1 Tax=Clostridium butyricum TaxID=1492 RepID=UPI00374F914F